MMNIWMKSYIYNIIIIIIIIGYPRGQDGPILTTRDGPLCSRKKTFYLRRFNSFSSVIFYTKKIFSEIFPKYFLSFSIGGVLK